MRCKKRRPKGLRRLSSRSPRSACTAGLLTFRPCQKKARGIEASPIPKKALLFSLRPILALCCCGTLTGLIINHYTFHVNMWQSHYFFRFRLPAFPTEAVLCERPIRSFTKKCAPFFLQRTQSALFKFSPLPPVFFSFFPFSLLFP